MTNQKILALLGLVAGVCQGDVLAITIDAQGNEVTNEVDVHETTGNTCEVDTECGTLCCHENKCKQNTNPCIKRNQNTISNIYDLVFDYTHDYEWDFEAL